MATDWLDVLLLGLLVISMLVAGWGFNSAWNEAEKSIPMQFRKPGLIQQMIDPFVWSRAASSALRRRYLITQGFFILGFACLTTLVWRHQGYPHGRESVVLVTVVNCILIVLFVRKCLRYWRGGN